MWAYVKIKALKYKEIVKPGNCSPVKKISGQGSNLSG
jgi:hypothetical protein